MDEARDKWGKIDSSKGIVFLPVGDTFMTFGHNAVTVHDEVGVTLDTSHSLESICIQGRVFRGYVSNLLDKGHNVSILSYCLI